MSTIKLRLLTFILALILLLFAPVTKVLASSILFQDDFNDGNSTGWDVVGSSGWNVQNGEYGILLNPGLSNAVPNNSLWNYNWINISFEVDVRGVQGVDKNILLKFKNTSNFLELHANDGGIFLDKGAPGGGRLASSNTILVNNVVYHFKFEMRDTGNIKVYKDNVLLFDIDETLPLITDWKIGLRAGTGATPVTEVWFDNVVVKSLDPTPTPATPVIVIPGMGASWNYEAMMHGQTGVPDTDWKIAPFVTLYNGIINALGDGTLIYPYDWRRNIGETAVNLAGFIDSHIPTGQVDLVGHSMGGLVARAYTQAHPDRVRNLVTVGSPHKGAVSVYKIWEGADFSDMPGWMGLASRLLLRVNRGSYPNEVAEVQALFPSLRNIWPIFGFTNRSLTWNNNFLPGLGVPTQLKTIYGAGINTPERLTLTNRSNTDVLLNKWLDGKPTATQMGSGDNAVLVTSSNIGGEELAGLTHDQIIGSAAGQNKVLQLLGLTGTTADVSQADLNQAVVVSVASPVNFSVVDPNGGSYSPTDGLVVINNPANGNYQVQLTAIGGGGNYSVYFGKLKNGDSAWESRTGNLGTGESTTYTFGAQMNQPNLGSAPLTTAIGRINNSLTLAGSNVILKQDLARIRSYLVDIQKPQSFDTKLSRLIRTIDSLIGRTKNTEVVKYLQLIKADLEQERADRFAN